MTSLLVGILLFSLVPAPRSVTEMARPGSHRNQTQSRRNLLPELVGSWTFTLGKRRGTREIRALYGDHAVEYDEQFEGTSIRGRGFLTYDAVRHRYLSMGLHDAPGTAGASVGTPSDDGATVVFRAVGGAEEDYPTESRLIVDGPDRFRYVLKQLRDNEWRTIWTAEFVRR
jgi:hypothetical protein